MFGWLSLIFGEIGGFMRDQSRVKELARLEAKRKARENHTPIVANDPELSDAINDFMSRVSKKTSAEPNQAVPESTAPPSAPAEEKKPDAGPEQSPS